MDIFERSANILKRAYFFVDRQDADPLTELLKHAFVLKTALGQCSRAEELESLTDSLEESQVYEDLGTYSTLQFLVGVKSYERTEDDSLVTWCRLVDRSRSVFI